MLISVSFAPGEKQGLLLTIALTLEVLFLGMSGAAALRGAGIPPAKPIAVACGLAGILPAGASIGGALLLSTDSAIVIDAVLSCGLAATFSWVS